MRLSRFVRDEPSRKNFEAVEAEINRLSRSMAAAPVAGTWALGDRVWNSEPAATEYIGWVCVVAGTPGTWKGFGAIQA